MVDTSNMYNLSNPALNDDIGLNCLNKSLPITPNGFEIEEIINGKVRFQNFGFIPWESGNLSFTKLI